jgi:BirA family transcriptional regulator, biotin operon repressor / biotin---[acetyl-CoA-carboxylase] ligase
MIPPLTPGPILPAFPALNLDRLKSESFIAEVAWRPVLPSTNDLALDLASRPETLTPLLVLADEQTAGRGRGANRWWSDRGALTFSLLLDLNSDPPVSSVQGLAVERWPCVALTAAVSLCDVLHALVPQVDCGLKWPNDVLIGGRKAAGVLSESPAQISSGPRRMVLGMGINVNNSLKQAPAELQSIATSLHDASGLEFDLTELLLAWLARFADNLAALAAGLPDLSARWQSMCLLNGSRVELRSVDRLITGLCRGIDAGGALLVDTDRGRERFVGGTVVRRIHL